MRTKTMVGIAVASALSWSYGAMAGNYGHAGADRSSGAGTLGADMTYGVVTPFSPSEAGPADLPRGDRYASIEQAGASSAGLAADREVVTPLASNEAGPNDIMLQRRGQSFHTARASRSMANPQTPWSPSEGGLNTFSEDMQSHARHVAEVEQARIAAAEWNANIAARSEADTKVSLSEPVGSTSGLSLQGSNERLVDPSRQSSVTEPMSPGVSSEAGMPSEVGRTSALRPESEYSIPVTEYNTVGILETPPQPTEYTVWSVEPLNPGADIATGDTVYVVPGETVVLFAPDFGQSSPLEASGEQSAAVSGESRETSEPPSL